MPTFVKRYSGQPSLAVLELTPNIAAQMKEYSCTAQKLGYSFASWKKRRFELKGQTDTTDVVPAAPHAHLLKMT